MQDEYFRSSLLNAICAKAGFRFVTSNSTLLDEILKKRCHDLGLSDFPAYLSYLGDPAHLVTERPILSSVLTSRETYFMRDLGLMTVLREILLPELLSRQANTHSLRLWSAACSSGEEPYSLRILCEETIPDISTWSVDILGSDIDPGALALARKACYRSWSFRGCSPEFGERYFYKTSDCLQLAPFIRNSVRFELIDLVGDDLQSAQKGMSGADLILCRNLFIYLDADAIQQVLQKLTASLAEGGYLLCAPGELYAHCAQALVTRVYPQAVVYQKQTLPIVAPEPILPLISKRRENYSFTEIKSVSLQAETAKPAKSTQESLAHAWQLANRGQIEAAQTLCINLRQEELMNPELYYLQALLALADGSPEQAREELRRVLYLQPAFVAAYPILIDIALAANDHTSARRACRQGISVLNALPVDQQVPLLEHILAGQLRDYLKQLCEPLSIAEVGEEMVK